MQNAAQPDNVRSQTKESNPFPSGDLACHAPCFRRVIAQAEHDQHVAEPGESQANATFVARFLGLLRQRPDRGIQHVIEHPRCRTNDARQRFEVKARMRRKRFTDEQRKVDAAQTTAAICRQGLFAARVGCRNRFAVGQVVIGVDAVNENHARFGMIIGRVHDLLP
jgi:hypothetical protein